MVIGIIGGGAAGMAAALSASENPNVQVILMERQNRVGRKLLATGNGRCNLSNCNLSVSHYHGKDPQFCAPAFEKYNFENTISWFEQLGLYTVVESTGKVYPYSDQAHSVVDVLRLNLLRPNITLKLSFDVEKIKHTDSMFTVCSGEETVCCDKLIVACGGLAGTKLGGSMSGYKLLGKLGHRAGKLHPSLVQLKSNWSALPSLKGVRANAKAEIIYNDELVQGSTGELQFTELGLSGPVIFEISRDACTASGRWTCKLDFLPEMDRSQLLKLLTSRKTTPLTVQELLTGILHNRLGRVLAQTSGLELSMPCRELTDNQFEDLCDVIKGLEVTLTEPMGMDSAQVTAGGVLTEGFDPHTMESETVKGLFACGEVLDIDGDCGGYNLQWAWSSGRLAGQQAGKDAK